MRDRLWRVIPPLDTASLVPGQTPVAVVFVTIAACAGVLATVSGVSPVAVGLAVVGGAGVGLCSRWVGGTHGTTLVCGGFAGMLGGLAGLGSLGRLVTALPGGLADQPVPVLVSSGLLWTSSVAVGLGATSLVAGSLDPERVSATLRRYVPATLLPLFGTGVVAGTVVAGETLAAVRNQAVEVIVTTLLSTADPAATGGPSMLLLFVGLRLICRAASSATPPLWVESQTRDRIRETADRTARVAGRISVVVLVAGLAFVWGHVTGALSAPVVTTTPLIAAVDVLGSPTGRLLALGACGAGIGALVTRGALDIRRQGLDARVVGATLPLVGVLAGIVVLATAATVLSVTVPRGAVPTGTVDELPAVALVGAGGLAGAVVTSLVVGCVFAVWEFLPRRQPGLGLLAGGLVGLAIVVAAVGAPAVVVFGLVALSLIVVDVGRVGSSVASEVGRHGGLRVDLVNETVTLGVGAAAVALAVGASQLQFRVPGVLESKAYLFGAAAFVTAFVLFGRLLSP
jgi:hypothetical protein